MSFPKVYTNIYWSPTNHRGLNMFFYNKNNGNAFLFDGFQFCYKLYSTFDSDLFREIDYSKFADESLFIIDTIRQDFDVSFIRLENGDIFQLFFMMDSTESPQQLSIFKAGSSFYDLAVGRFNEATICRVEEEADGNVSDWLNR